MDGCGGDGACERRLSRLCRSDTTMRSPSKSSSLMGQLAASLYPLANFRRQLQCAMEIIPKSECKSFTNQTCLCTNDPVIARIEACVLDKCNVTDAHSKAENSQYSIAAKPRRRPV
jgi:hypothetical protein